MRNKLGVPLNDLDSRRDVLSTRDVVYSYLDDFVSDPLWMYVRSSVSQTLLRNKVLVQVIPTNLNI